LGLNKLAAKNQPVEARHQAAQAIKLLQATLPYELGQTPPIPFLYPVYVRGQAYLKLGQPGQAVVEFQNVLKHPGWTNECSFGAMAHLQLARAQWAGGDRLAALASYQEFLSLWRNADYDVPIYKQAKAEYAKLKLGCKAGRSEEKS